MLTDTDDAIRALLKETRRIAVVGISANEERPSHRVARYLIDAGYDVVPVNPGLREIFGRRCFAHVRDIEGGVDMIDVFRRPEEVPAIVDDAIAIGAKSLWLQLGVIAPEAAERAAAAGLKVVMDRCTKIEHARLIA